MRKLLIILVVVILGAGVWFFLIRSDSAETSLANPNSSQEKVTRGQERNETSNPKEFIRIAAMGDMLPHDTVNLRAKSGSGYDYLQFLEQVKPQLEGSDIVFCNQESPSAGESLGVSGYPTFNAPVEFSRDLNKFGCNLINLANNHIADKGQSGIDETLSTWEALNTLGVSGANRNAQEQNSVTYFESNGKKFAFIAFTDLSNNSSISSASVNMFNNELVTSLTTEASQNSDYVIASAHWGVEDSSTVSDSQRQWAKLMADAGVNLIIGSGPHVLQPVEKIGDTIVWYSLGNFLSTQLTIEQLTGGIAYIDLPLDGGEPEISFLPTYMHYTWTAQQAAVEDLLARDNLDVIPLANAVSEIENSLFETTSEAQLRRITQVLGDSVEIISPN